MTTEIRPSAAHQKPSGKMYLAAYQYNLVSGVYALVELDTISAGFTDGIEDVVNHRITPGPAGFYDVKAQVYFKNVIADTRYVILIYLNGTTEVGVACMHANIAEYLSANLSIHLHLAATDYLELKAMSRAGVNTVDIQPGENYTFLSVQRVR